MVSENSSSLLRASLIFFLASLMLGSAAMYIQFGIVSLLVLWSYRGSGLKSTFPDVVKVSKPVWVMFLLFAVIFTIAILWNRSVPIAELGEIKWLLFPIVFVLALFAISSETRFRPIEKVAIVFFFLVSVYSLVDSTYQVTTGREFSRVLLSQDAPIVSIRGSGLLKNSIPFAHVVGSLFYIGIAGAIVAFSTGKRKVALVFSGFALMFFLCVLASLARGAWFAIALTALFSLFVVPKGFRKVNLIGLGVAALSGIGILALNGVLFQRFFSSFDPDVASNMVRVHLWMANLEMLIDHPFGMGFNANDSLLPAKLVELGYPADSFQTHPHNEYLDYAVATGFPGLLLYLGVTIWLLIFTVKLLRRANLTGTRGDVFFLISSALIQSFLNGCALTDQFTTPGRFLICLAWAVPLAMAVKYRTAPAVESSS